MTFYSIHDWPIHPSFVSLRNGAFWAQHGFNGLACWDWQGFSEARRYGVTETHTSRINLNIKLVHCDVNVWWDSPCCAACGSLKAWHFFVPPWVPPKMRCMFTGEDLLEAHSFCIDDRFLTLFLGIWASTKGCSRPFSPNSEEDSNGTVWTFAFSPIKYGRQVCKWKGTLLKCCFWGSLYCSNYPRWPLDHFRNYHIKIFCNSQSSKLSDFISFQLNWFWVVEYPIHINS